MMWASKNGFAPLVRMLLLQGAEWLLEDINGHSAFMLSLINHHKKVADCFFELRKVNENQVCSCFIFSQAENKKSATLIFIYHQVNMQTIRTRCGKLVIEELLSEERKSEHVRFLYQLGIQVPDSLAELEEKKEEEAPKTKPVRKQPTSPIFGTTEVLLQVLSYLDAVDLCRVACVSKTTNFLAR